MAKPVPQPLPIPDESQPSVPTFVDTVKTEDDDLDLGPIVIEEAPAEGNPEKYFESVGRRKRAIARVRLFTRKSGDPARDDRALMTINGKDYLDYFTDAFLQERVEGPLKRLKSLGRFKVSVQVLGGGLSGQADAVRHGISRTLELFDSNFRKKLKKAGFLTRDPRRVQRKMPGLKKARKGPRWSKR